MICRSLTTYTTSQNSYSQCIFTHILSVLSLYLMRLLLLYFKFYHFTNYKHILAKLTHFLHLLSFLFNAQPFLICSRYFRICSQFKNTYQLMLFTHQSIFPTSVKVQSIIPVNFYTLLIVNILSSKTEL